MPLEGTCEDREVLTGLERRLSRFAALLRKEGLPVGTSEILDAMQALQEVDLANRTEVKTAVKAVFAKSQRSQEIFNSHFDSYFVPPEESSRRHQEEQQQRQEQLQKIETARSNLQFKGEALNLSPEEMVLYASLTEEQQQGILRFVQETEEGKKVEKQFRPVLESVVKGHLRYWRERSEREKNLRMEEGGEGASSGDPDSSLSTVDIQAIREGDLPAAEELIWKMSRRLAAKMIRRRQKSSRQGPLDLRRSIRENLRFGGSIFILKHRKKRSPKQRLLMLGDVSASMSRYSTFVLQFIYGLQAAVHDLESFSFADGLEYLTPDLREQPQLQSVLNRVVKGSKTWGGGTNIGFSLNQLRANYPELLNYRTTVLVVSDTKTVALEASLEELRKLKEQVRDIVWLNPLPTERWRDYRSVAAVQEIAEMWPCHTLTQLEQAVTGGFMNKVKKYHINEGGMLS